MKLPFALRPAREPWHLSDPVRATVASIARVVCPQHADELDVTTISGAHELVDEVEASMAALPSLLRTGLAAALAAYDAGARARYRKPAHQLDLAKSRDYYEAWLHLPGPTHEFALRVKQFICMAYYELPAVRAALDYRPEQWIARVKAERLERHGEAIRAHERSLRAPDPLPRPAPQSQEASLVPTSRLVRARRPHDDPGDEH